MSASSGSRTIAYRVVAALLCCGLLLPGGARANQHTIYDVWPGQSSGAVENPAVLNGKAYFVALAGFASPRHLWLAEPGDLVPFQLTNNCNASQPTPSGGWLFFVCDTAGEGKELWQTDGTLTGTALVKDIVNGAGQSAPEGLIDVDGTLFFTALDSSNGRELWKSDGTSGGTVLVKDINPGAGSTTFSSGASKPNFVAWGATLYFVADDGSSGAELWKSDGTASGTQQIKDINPGPGSALAFAANTFAPVRHMVPHNGRLYFAANDGSNGTELWATDGTADGTVLVKDIAPGAASSFPDDFEVAGGILFFATSDGGLWKTDGTANGTVLVKQFQPGGVSWLTDIAGTLFFQGDDGVSGAELWKSDGTSGGTVLVKDIRPGSAGSFPGKPAEVAGRAYFSADDGSNGDELWVSNGTAAGTTLFLDINSGSDSSLVDEPVNVNGTLFFVAETLATGREVMAVGIVPPAPVDARPNSSANFRQASTSQDPVNLFTGELFTRPAPDLWLGGPMPLYFQRYYAAHLRRSNILGDLGSNWRHNFDARFYWSGNAATYVSAEGRVTQFVRSGSSWSQQDNLDTVYSLYAEAGEDVRLYDPESGRIYTFDFTSGGPLTGRLIRVEDGHGNTHSLTYDAGTGQLQSVSDGLGRTLQFGYNSDATPKIASVSDGTRSVGFAYTDPIDTESLTRVTDARGGVTVYRYADTSGTGDHALLLAVQRPRGNTPYSQTFDANGRVATQQDAAGNVFTFAYSGSQTTITDPLGNTWTDTHDSNGALTRRLDRAGEAIALTTDGTGRRTALTDRLGNTTRFDYDSGSGRLSGIVNAEGNRIDYAFSPRTFNQVVVRELTGITHADGTQETFNRDNQGNLLGHTGRDGRQRTATYNANGQPLTLTNPAGGMVTLTYNGDATLASHTDPAGNTTTFTYDTLRRLTAVTHADGKQRLFDYNENDQLVSATDENGRTITLAYDANGNLTSLTDPANHTIAYAYDDNDRLREITDPLGATASRSYDALGRLAAVTDRNGLTTRFDYDARDRLVRITDAGGAVWQRSYDAEAIPSAITDPLNNTTTFQSDGMGRITAVTSPLGHVTGMRYDSMGRLTAVTDALGNTTTIEYDARGLRRAVTLSDGASVRYTRDALGNLTTITDPAGNDWQRSYDQQGRLTEITDPLGNTQALSYDARNRASRVTFPGGLGTLDLSHEPAGSLSRLSYSDGTLLDFTYDANGRLTQAEGIRLAYDANGEISESNGLAIGRDSGGRITSLTFASGKTVTYQYGTNGRLRRISDWLGNETTFSFDDAGRLTGITRPNGIHASFDYDGDGRLVLLVEGSLIRITLTRDGAGRITAAARDVPLAASAADLPDVRRNFDAAAQMSDAGYDALGRLTTEGNDRYTWDLASRLTAYTRNGTTVAATYDARSLRLSRSSGGTTRDYVWNHALDLPAISVEREGGNDRYYYVHTPGGMLLYRIEAASGMAQFYHYDETGNTLFVSDGSGTDLARYAYTPYGRLIAREGNLDNPFTWQGRFGVMSEGDDLYYLRARYYDARSGRFLSRDPRPGTGPRRINPYQYAFNSPLQRVDPRGLRSDSFLRAAWRFLDRQRERERQRIDALLAAMKRGQGTCGGASRTAAAKKFATAPKKRTTGTARYEQYNSGFDPKDALPLSDFFLGIMGAKRGLTLTKVDNTLPIEDFLEETDANDGRVSNGTGTVEEYEPGAMNLQWLIEPEKIGLLRAFKVMAFGQLGVLANIVEESWLLGPSLLLGPHAPNLDGGMTTIDPPGIPLDVGEEYGVESIVPELSPIVIIC